MSKWQSIETAAHDGTIIKAKRVFEGATVWEGLCCWRTVHFDALPPHPIDGDIYAPAHDQTAWAMPDQQHLVPTPTHWSAGDVK